MSNEAEKSKTGRDGKSKSVPACHKQKAYNKRAGSMAFQTQMLNFSIIFVVCFV
jgi:hypothetical protein